MALAKRLLLVLGMALAACASITAPRVWPSVIEAFYPEGPLYQGERLYYAEMGADRISMFERGQRRTFFEQDGCGPTAIAPYGEGFLVLCHIGARVVAIDAEGRELRRWQRDDAGHALRDPNDCYADGHGGVFFSDPGNFSRQSSPHGYVMHLSADGRLKRASGVLWYPNGVFVRGDEVYVTEHMAGKVWRYTQRDDGTLADQQMFVDVKALNVPSRYDTPYAETGPDGLEIGPDGDLWVAIYGEGRVLRFSPQGELVGDVEARARYLTNISFDPHGGAATTGTFDNLNAPFPGEVRFHPASTLTRRPD